MPQVDHERAAAQGFSLWKWIAWATALLAGLCVAISAVDRHRMEQIRTEIESRGGRLEGNHFFPDWYQWLLEKTPSAAARGILLKLKDSFQRVVRVQMPPGSDAPHDLISRLTRFQRLRGLELVDCNLTDADLDGLSKLTELRVLNLGGNPVTDRGLAQLEHLPNLAALFFTRDQG